VQEGSPPILVGEPHYTTGRGGEQLTTMFFFDAQNSIDFIRICVSIWMLCSLVLGTVV
jgi:hypothetical protein